MLKRYIGDRAFYRRAFGIAIPILIQNGITNFVSLLDNIMVGQVGTLQMSGVSIVNNLLLVFNLCIFGACSGAGIFTAQFYGSEDHENIRYTFRFKMMICALLALIGIGIFYFFGDTLINLYLQGEGSPQDAALTLDYGFTYLKVMLWGLVPFALSNAYAGTLRETDQTLLPMVGGICAVFVNLFFNYVLIFGHFGAPALGAEGAAIATVISRFAELAIVAGWTHLHGAKNPFIRGVYRSLHIPKKLFMTIMAKGMPLLINEFFWSTGVAMLSQCYSTCGLDVVPAMNISTTLYNLANVSFIAMGNAVGIITGQMLGANIPREKLLGDNRKLIAVSTAVGIVFSALMLCCSSLFPGFYNTTQEIRTLASRLIMITACLMPFTSYVNAIYFTLRSGGQTGITFLFDSGFSWLVCVPLAYCLSRFTGMTILPLFFICQATEILKAVLGAIVLKKGKWIKNLTTA